jgi:AraC family transcriptional regulator, transcriptional activator of pobA
MASPNKNLPPEGHSPLVQFSDLPLGENKRRSVLRSSHTLLLWIQHGEGSLQLDESAYDLQPDAWVFLGPYQPFSIFGASQLVGHALYFHYDFFCLEAHGAELGCNEVLFSCPYRSPLVKPSRAALSDMSWLMNSIHREVLSSDVSSDALLVSYIRSLLVIATREKLSSESADESEISPDNVTINKLQRLINEYYKEKSTLREYSELLAVSPRALERLMKLRWEKSLGQVIQERLIIEAKRELYMTNKPIKVIAHELGFNDQYYFSRFFKKCTNVSPMRYREEVGVDKGRT